MQTGGVLRLLEEAQFSWLGGAYVAVQLRREGAAVPPALGGARGSSRPRPSLDRPLGRHA